jgi:hypothetical protein
VINRQLIEDNGKNAAPTPYKLGQGQKENGGSFQISLQIEISLISEKLGITDVW